MVTQRAAGGAALFVDIAAGSGAFARVQGGSVNGQGLYVVGPHSAAVITEAIAPPNVSNPRIDIAVLEVFDNAMDGSGLNIARVRVIAGTPTAGTTLNSRAGVATLPTSALLLADILVTAGATSVSNTQIRDRRKWARGAFSRSVRQTGTSYSAPTTPTIIDATLLNPRIECSGAPMRATLIGHTLNSGAAPGTLGVELGVDGARTLAPGGLRKISLAAGYSAALSVEWVFTPSAGSHLIAPFASQDGLTTFLIGDDGVSNIVWIVEELVRQTSTNASVTSG